MMTMVVVVLVAVVGAVAAAAASKTNQTGSVLADLIHHVPTKPSKTVYARTSANFHQLQ